MDNRRGKKNKGGPKNAWGNTSVAPRPDNNATKVSLKSQNIYGWFSHTCAPRKIFSIYFIASCKN